MLPCFGFVFYWKFYNNRKLFSEFLFHYFYYNKVFKHLGIKKNSKLYNNLTCYEDFYTEDTLKNIKKYYDSLNPICQTFFTSRKYTYEKYLKLEIIKYINESDTQLLKKNKEILTDILINNLDSTDIVVLTDKIKEKLNRNVENKRKDILNAFEEDVDIVKKKKVIQQI